MARRETAPMRRAASNEFLPLMARCLAAHDAAPIGQPWVDGADGGEKISNEMCARNGSSRIIEEDEGQGVEARRRSAS